MHDGGMVLIFFFNVIDLRISTAVITNFPITKPILA